MKRIRYTELSSGQDVPRVMVSQAAFDVVTDGVASQVLIHLHGDNVYQITDAVTGAVVSQGEANNHIVLKRKAKDALLALGNQQTFVKEERKKRK